MVLLILSVLSAVVFSLQSFTDVTNIYQKGKLNYSVYTGYVDIDIPEDSSAKCSMFYQYVTKEGESLTNHSNDSPVLLWLNGGPGSSSQLGSWTEIGPFFVNHSTVQERPYRWNKLAHLIFVDQPVSNVGLSFCRDSNYIVRDTSKASEHFLQLIKKVLISKSGSLSSLSDNPFYLLGESFGGHYAPYFANVLLNSTNINLKGVALADGWVNPSFQLMNYDSVIASAAIIGPALKDRLVGLSSTAYQNILERNYAQAFKQFDVLTDSGLYGCNLYNFLQAPENGPQEHEGWINNNKEAYGIPSFVNFTGGNSQIYYAFASDITLSYSRQVEALLEKTKVLVYVGQLDLIVNTPTTYDFVNALNWPRKAEWQSSKKQLWKINGKVVGTVKAFENMTMAVVYGAGHMVPTDRPEPAFELAKSFLASSERPFGEYL